MDLGSTQAKTIKRFGETIARLFNDSKILSEHYPVGFNLVKGTRERGGSYPLREAIKAVQADFFLNENTYSKANYSIETVGKDREFVVANGAGVNSNLGVNTGTLMFHLQLYLMFKSDGLTFFLNNFTDDPGRAARGIYSLLDVNKTRGTHGTPLSDFRGEDLDEQLLLSEGEMIKDFAQEKIAQEFQRQWEDKMREIAKNVERKKHEESGYDPKGIWSSDLETKMDRFIRMLNEQGWQRGGKKRKTKSIKKGKRSQKCKLSQKGKRSQKGKKGQKGKRSLNGRKTKRKSKAKLHH